MPTSESGSNIPCNIKSGKLYLELYRWGADQAVLFAAKKSDTAIHPGAAQRCVRECAGGRLPLGLRPQVSSSSGSGHSQQVCGTIVSPAGSIIFFHVLTCFVVVAVSEGGGGQCGNSSGIPSRHLVQR